MGRPFGRLRDLEKSRAMSTKIYINMPEIDPRLREDDERKRGDDERNRGDDERNRGDDAPG